MNNFFLFHSRNRTKQYVGKIIDGFFDERYGQLVVTTESNVVAALSLDTGDIIWRRVLEKEDRGSLKLLQAIHEDSVWNPNSLRVNGRQEPDRYAVTVEGTSYVLIRGWNLRTGNLVWEWVHTDNGFVRSNEHSYWFYTKSTLYHAQPDWSKSIIEVAAFNVENGQQVGPAANLIQILSSQKENCLYVKSYLVCLSNNEVNAVNLVTGASKTVATSNSLPKIVNVSRKVSNKPNSFVLKLKFNKIL